MDKEKPIVETGNFKTAIAEVIKNKNLDSLINVLEEANELLTGQPKDEFEFDAGFERLKQDLAKFFQKMEQSKDAEAMVYLGDGGYSRLILNIVGGRINVSLSPVSTAEVKEKWVKIE